MTKAYFVETKATNIKKGDVIKFDDEVLRGEYLVKEVLDRTAFEKRHHLHPFQLSSIVEDKIVIRGFLASKVLNKKELA